MTESSLRASLRHFESTAHASPANPLGYAGEAAASTKLADIEEGSPSAIADAFAAGRLARRALALDGSSPDAIAVKGYIEYDLDGDNAAAAADLRRAVGLAPDLAVAHLWYGAALLWQGQQRAARVELQRAASLDSGLPGLYYLLALDYYMSHDYGDAVAFADSRPRMIGPKATRGSCLPPRMTKRGNTHRPSAMFGLHRQACPRR